MSHLVESIELSHSSLTKGLKTFGIVLSGAFLLAALSQVSIPMYPVPVTLQTLGLLFLGLFLTPTQAFYAAATYLAAATIGLPVLSAGHINPLWILEPAAGYLASFPFAAYLMAYCRQHINVISGIFLSQLLTLSLGMTWLAVLTSFETAFWTGFVVFIPGTLLKSAIALCTSKIKL